MMPKEKNQSKLPSCGLMEKVCKGTSWVDGKVPSPVCEGKVH